jgi:hypothetical protein
MWRTADLPPVEMKGNPMRIEIVQQYRIGGAVFDSEKAARDWIEDQVGAIIDKGLAGRLVGPGDKLALHAAILNNANTLRALLEAYASPAE